MLQCVSFLHHDVCRTFRETHSSYTDANAAVSLSVTICAVYADTLYFFSANSSISNLAPIYSSSSLVIMWLLSALFLSRNELFARFIVTYLQINVVFQTESFGNIRLTLYFFHCRYLAYRQHGTNTRCRSVTSTANKDWLHNYRHT